ncbi:DUF2750 domain-containing protein [Pectobacterium wasabiae]|uniref:DUF2750 domain-containing protein n=1 Tax=Pectobacterium wasabiae TaxID=55208 RepID=A0AAW3EB82_9GAMM|nr:DUF2750 domain-containing protein [Pectobacterium wasabiae]AOR65409.1 hypothetical protein A7983_19510 [Pectobacterium wasabiae CFBP 3304]EJS93158.1 Hypothetical protein Y17_3656 [Pectobacterium wasabiae CFBP 3304]KFX01448.1 hypothetical protein JV38_22260 [Pectobacterium wasabiae]KGA26333.1 hypothetical protein KU73_21920 [Pectobacterium wasabiae]
MNNSKIENVNSLTSEDRLSYFVRKVADFEQVWGSYGNDGWLHLSTKDGKRIFPIWPEEEFSIDYNTKHQYELSPKEIDLYYFLDKWIPGLEKDGVDILIFPVDKKNGIIIIPSKLNELLQDELKQYE